MFLFGGFFVALFFIPKAFAEWKGYLRKKFQAEKERTLLEIRIPREINKTPQAMELVLNALLEQSNGDWYTDITTGKQRPFYSFEIASHGGSVHFYIWIEKDFKARVEAHFYAQYPEVELIEVKDYAIHYPFSWDTHKSFGFEYELIKPDPVPILTYKLAGFDRGGLKPEEQIDPITQTIEALSNINSDEEMWMQIVCRTHLGTNQEDVAFIDRFFAFFKVISLFGKLSDRVKNCGIVINGKKTTNCSKEGLDLIKQIRSKYKADEGIRELSKNDKTLIEIVADNISKPAYDVGIRTLYIAPKESFDGNSRNHMMGSIFKQYSTGEIYNGLKPGLIPTTNYPWQDKSGKKMRKLRDEMYKSYKRRKFMLESPKDFAYGNKMYKKFVLSTEELATLFHLPGQVAQTPTFERIDSVTGQAPANLPI